MSNSKITGLAAAATVLSTDVVAVVVDPGGTPITKKAALSVLATLLNTSPTLVTPALGTPASGVMTNVTGTAAGLTAGNVTTNANLTGHVTSAGNAAVLGSFTSAQLATALTNETGTGVAVFNTNPTFEGTTKVSVLNAIIALAGGAQAGTALTAEVNRVTTVAVAADSVQLPISVAGHRVYVINAAAANAVAVFGQTGDVINALAANTALSVAANKTVCFVCAVAGTWNSIVTA